MVRPFLKSSMASSRPDFFFVVLSFLMPSSFNKAAINPFIAGLVASYCKVILPFAFWLQKYNYFFNVGNVLLQIDVHRKVVAKAAEIARTNVSTIEFLAMIGLVVLQHKVGMEDAGATFFII